LDLNALILTYNEEPNIARTLDKLDWVPHIVVLDSGSDDRTVEIAETYENVTVFERTFDNHTNQWNYGLNYCDINSEWVLALDADYQVEKELAVEIQRVVRQHETSPRNGYWARFKYAIDGQIIESGIYPPVQVLYRRAFAQYVPDGHTQRIEVEGDSSWLDHPIIHDDRKSLTRWAKSQVNYAQLEAEKLDTTPKSQLSREDKIRRKSKLTPLIVFFYVLFVRSAWRDGTPGWKYAYQRLIAEIFIQYHLLDRNSVQPDPSSPKESF
jgi:glycosyltransferase involved in cell wall biosynthesis